MHNDKVMALLLKVLETLKNAPKENHTKKIVKEAKNQCAECLKCAEEVEVWRQ